LPTTINSYFDPQVEFLELGVTYGKTTEWKLMGPDLNGVYGGMNGTGGFEAVSPYLNLFEPTISDFRGNILGVVTNSVAVSWNQSRPTGYGAVPNYRPAPLANGANIAQASAWRGHWSDITGYNQIGLRPYDPVSGRWLTFDSVWNERDPNYFSFSGGDPVNAFDHDGRMSKTDYQTFSDQFGAYEDSGGAGGLGGFYSQSGALQYYFNGRSWDSFSYNDRMNAMELVAGGKFQDESMFGSDSSGPSRSAGSEIANAVWNTDLLQESWDEWQNRDFSTGIGTATAITAGAGLVFGGADAVVNSIPILGTGKAVLEDAGKAGLKSVAKIFGKDAAEGGLYEQTLAKVDSLNFTTPKDSALFYSGPGNRAFAMQLADDTGRFTIDSTPGGQYLNSLKLYDTLPQAQADAIWTKASQAYVNGASGEVNAYINGASLNRVYFSTELPALMRNANVTTINHLYGY
jgi:RHS repeat-associated protein